MHPLLISQQETLRGSNRVTQICQAAGARCTYSAGAMRNLCTSPPWPHPQLMLPPHRSCPSAHRYFVSFTALVTLGVSVGLTPSMVIIRWSLAQGAACKASTYFARSTTQSSRGSKRKAATFDTTELAPHFQHGRATCKPHCGCSTRRCTTSAISSHIE